MKKKVAGLCVLWLGFLLIACEASGSGISAVKSPTPSPLPPEGISLSSPLSAPSITSLPKPTLSKVEPTVTVDSATAEKIPLLTPHTTVDAPLGRSLIVVIAEDTEEHLYIKLVDLEKGGTRPLQLEGSEIIGRKVHWLRKGCHMAARLSKEGLVEFDLRGKDREILFSYQNPESEQVLNAQPSPMGEWVAYMVGRGDLLYDRYEFQDLKVLNTRDSGDLFQLTERGGTWSVNWSSDGQYLAYSDYDLQDIHQLYVSHPDGTERRQLTAFKDPEGEFGAVAWSPDNKRVAAIYSETLAIIPFENSTQRTTLAEKVQAVGTFWWHDSDTLAVFAAYTKTPREMAIYWLDVSSGQILDMLLESETPEDSILMPKPLPTAGRIGFFSGSLKFYVYDSISEGFECKSYREESDFLWFWSAAPSTFEGETMCNP